MSTQDPFSAPFGARFELRRRLGEGGYGVVYQAYDHRRRAVVALKELTRVEPRALARFKGEFRALVDVVHPNLVTLYELFAEEDRWFFTMEYVEGVDFLHYVWGGGARVVSPRTATRRAGSGERTWQFGEAPTVDSGSDAGQASGGFESGTGAWEPPEVRGAVRPGAYDETRLRRALGQLGAGVEALHSSGRLHRDLKPTNVRVTPEGRVVVLDFGLVLALGDAGEAERREFAGTPAYMSPEQAAQDVVAEPSDCYAVGVMLFEALTGRRPFEGPLTAALVSQAELEAPRVQELAPEVPPDLDQLCTELLCRDPADRPRAAEVRARAIAGGGTDAAAPGGGAAPTPTVLREGGDEHFLGRDRELSALHEAFGRSELGQPSAVFVSGRSGIGKSALVRRFLAEIRERRPEAVLLDGRCHQQESVPYKGVDAAVDALARFLRQASAEERRLCLPADALYLAQVFPVLLPVATRRAVSRPAGAPTEGALEAQELRRRAFGALRELLERLATLRPVVLALDDLQWGDDDSGALLAEVLREPEAPPLCFVGAFRSDEEERSPLLKRLRVGGPGGADLPPVERLELTPLPPAESARLAELLLAGAPGDSPLAARIARESEGNPFLVGELSWVLRQRGTAPQPGASLLEAPTVGEVVELRLAGLAPPLRRLLEVTAVAGVPVATECLLDAADIGELGPAALAALRAARLVRVHPQGSSDRLECYHDRIREAVVLRLTHAQRQGHHAALAQALEAVDPVDAEGLARHLLAAGDRPRAGQWLVRAAERAAEALAFDRAARLYAQAVHLLPSASPERLPLLRGQGEALVAGGRSAEAGRVLLLAAAAAPRTERLDLEAQAAELLLKGGHYDEGLIHTRRVFRALGMSLPRSRTAAYLAAGWELGRLKLRGLGFTPRPAALRSATRRRCDACWAVAEPLQAVDPVLSFILVLRHTRLALDSGEPFRAARALALQCVQTSMLEPLSEAPLEVLRAGQRVARLAPDPRLDGYLTLAEGSAAFFRGDFVPALRLGLEAARLLQEAGRGMQWELSSTELVILGAMQWLGRWGELRERLPGSLRAAAQRGDLYGAAGMSAAYGGFPGLVLDDAERAHRGIATFRAQHSKDLRYFPETFEAISRAYVGLYEGTPEATLGDLRRRWPQLERQGLTQVPLMLAELIYLKGCAHLGILASAGPAGVAHARRGARRALSRLAAQGLPLGAVLREILSACLHAAEGRVATAVARLSRVEPALKDRELLLHLAAVRHLRGRLVGGGEGAALVALAEARMRDQGIQDPARMAQVFAPA